MRDLKRRNSKSPAYLQLAESGLTVFTPLKWEVTVRGGRRIRREVPIITDLLFVRAPKEQLDAIVATIPTLQYRYVRGRTIHEPMTVRDADMDRFIDAVSRADNVRYYMPDEIRPDMYGREIRVVGGPFDGYEGRLLSMRGSRKKTPDSRNTRFHHRRSRGPARLHPVDKMTIAVDFDGTIVDHCYPSIGKERPFAVATLRQLQRDYPDMHLILWTVREGQLLQNALEWCDKRGLTFYAVNSNFPEEPLSATASNQGCRKVGADIYIDDRNLGGLPSWPEIYRRIKALSTPAGGAAKARRPSLLARLFGKK